MAHNICIGLPRNEVMEKKVKAPGHFFFQKWLPQSLHIYVTEDTVQNERGLCKDASLAQGLSRIFMKKIGEVVWSSSKCQRCKAKYSQGLWISALNACGVS